jgi:hypothetical protein
MATGDHIPYFSWDKEYKRLPDEGNLEIYEQGGLKYKLEKSKDPIAEIVQPTIDRSNPFFIDFTDQINAGVEYVEQAQGEGPGMGKVLGVIAKEAAKVEGATMTGMGIGSLPFFSIPSGGSSVPIGGFIGRVTGAYTASLAAQKELGLEPSKGMAFLDVVMSFNPFGRVARKVKFINEFGSNVGGAAIRKLSSKDIISKAFADRLAQDNSPFMKAGSAMLAGTTGGAVTGGIYSTYNQWETGDITMGQIFEDAQKTALFGLVTSAGIRSLSGTKNLTIKEYDKALVNKDHAFHKDANVIQNIMDGTVKASDSYVKKKASDIFMGFKTAYSDRYEYIKRLQKDSGGENYYNNQGILRSTDDSTDAYQRFRLEPGQVIQKQQQQAGLRNTIKEFTQEMAAKNGFKYKEFRQIVNQYMIARRQLEINNNNPSPRGKPFTGISNEDLKKKMDAIEKLSFFKDDLKPIIDMKQDMAHMILKEGVDAGIYKGGKDFDPTGKTRTEDTYLQILKKNPFYVPLNREVDWNKINTSGKINQKSIAPKSAKQLKEDPSGDIRDLDINLQFSMDDAIFTAERNKSLQVAAKLVEKNPHAQDVVGKVITVKNKETGKPLRVDEYQRPNSNHIEFYENGKRKAIDVTDTKNDMFKEALTWMPLEQRSSFYNFNSMLVNSFSLAIKAQSAQLTAYEPTFQFRNLIRDKQDAFLRNLHNMDLKNAFSVFSPTQLFADAATIYKHGQMKNTRTFNNNDIDYIEFLQNGGGAGSYGVDFQNSVQTAFKKLEYADMFGANHNKVGRNFIEFVGTINSVFEQNTRFNVYKAAKKAGATPQQAALQARDSSFDPLAGGRNQRGLSTAYMFANPAIQGTKNFFRAMNPTTEKGRKNMAIVGSGLFTLGVYQEYHNNSVFGTNWRDYVGADTDYGNFILGNHWVFIDPKHAPLEPGGAPQNLGPDGRPSYKKFPMGFAMSTMNTIPSGLAQFAMNPEFRNGGMESLRSWWKKTIDTVQNNTQPLPLDLKPTVYRNVMEIAGVEETDIYGRKIKKWSPKTTTNPFYTMDSEIVQLSPSKDRIPAGYDKTTIGKITIGMADLADKVLDAGGVEKNKFTPETFEHFLKTYAKVAYTTADVAQAGWHIFNNVYNGVPLPKDIQIPIVKAFYGEGYTDTVVKDLNLYKPSIQSLEDETYLFNNKGYNAVKGVEKEYKKALREGEFSPHVDAGLFESKAKEMLMGDPKLYALWNNKKIKIDNNVGFFQGRLKNKGRTDQARIMLKMKQTLPDDKYNYVRDEMIDNDIINPTTIKRMRIIEQLEKNGELIGLSPSLKEILIREKTEKVKSR